MVNILTETKSYKESITYDMIYCQMNLIESMLEEKNKIELIPEYNQEKIIKINAFKTLLTNAKYKLIEYLGNINQSIKKTDINKLKNIKKQCVKINDSNDPKFTIITTALIDILLETE